MFPPLVVTLISILLRLSATLVSAHWDYIDIVSVQNLNSTGPIVNNLFVQRVSHETFGISGNITFGEYQQFKCDARIFHSVKPDGNYILMPFEVAAKPMCTMINDFYVKYIMRDIGKVSDLPQVDGPGQEVCDMLTNHTFTLEKYIFNHTMVPEKLPTGMFKLEVRVLDGDNTVVSGLQTIITVS